MKAIKFPNFVIHLMNLSYLVSRGVMGDYHNTYEVFDTCKVISAIFKSLFLTLISVACYAFVSIFFFLVFYATGVSLVDKGTNALLTAGAGVLAVVIAAIFGILLIYGLIYATLFIKKKRRNRWTREYRPSAISTLWYSVRNRVCIPVTFADHKNEKND